MAAGPVLGTKVFTHLQEREGRERKKKNDTNAPYEKRQIGSTAGARGKRRQTFSPGP